jgi:hypothetical protein
MCKTWGGASDAEEIPRVETRARVRTQYPTRL